MPFDAGDFLQITCHMKFLGKDVQNTWHAAVTAAGSNDDVDQLDDVAEWFDFVYTLLAAEMPDDLEFDSISVYDLTQDAPIGTVAWPVLVAGADLISALSPAIALCVRFSTGLPRREGRKYFGPWTGSANTDPGVADANAVGQSLLTALRYTNGFTGANGASFQPRIKTVQFGVNVFVAPQSVIVNNEWDFQRRRKVSVGS